MDQNYAKAKELSFTPEGVEMMSQYLGTDLKKITNEIEKIKLNIKGKNVSTNDIEQFIGISRDFDVYALLRSLSAGDIPKVHQITRNLESNQKDQPLPRLIPAMATYFEKVLVVAQHFKKDDRAIGSLIGTYPSFVKEYRQAARRYGISGLQRAYHFLVKADGMSKGLDRRNQEGILNELVGQLILLQRPS